MLSHSLLIRRQFKTVTSALFSATSNKYIAKPLHTKSWEFNDSHRGVSGVYHHTISLEEHDKDSKKTAEAIHNTIVKHPDALFFLTEKSRLLRKSDDNPNFYLPMTTDDLLNIKLMINLIQKRWLRPHAGHTCMAITDCHGSILDHTHVSLRPNKGQILSGKTAFHPNLYSSLSAGSSLAQHTTVEEEILKLASKMQNDKSISADLTVLPLASTNKELNDILENIKSARAIKLYNLCSLIVKKEDIDEITDVSIKKYVEELKREAAKFPELQQATTQESETVLAALACTHVIAKACYGYKYAIDETVGPDQDTQTAAVYCAMALLGSDRFIEFARKINFLDHTSNLTKTNNKP